jgi:flagellar motor switch protein FliN/FliY
MSVEEGADRPESLNRILDAWTDALARVLESMTDVRPQMVWQGAAAPAAAAPEEILWWEQPVQPGPATAVWVGAPRKTWEYAGTATLKAAGLEGVASSEAKNTWFEILRQSLSVLARSIGGVLGREILCEGGSERRPGAGLKNWASVAVAFGELSLPPLLVGFSTELVALVASPSVAETELEPAQTDESGTPPSAAQAGGRSRTLDLLLEVELPVSISFGRTNLPMRDVLRLTTGSIVELNRTVTDPVEILVNQKLIARGEVVVVDGNYGVRIQEIATRGDRLRSLA